MTTKNTRRGETQQDVNKNSHSRLFLSGIYNAICCQTRQKTLLNGVRGRSPIPTFGDDAFFDNGGFTPYRHAECITASSRYDNNKTLKQVQGDGMRGFTLIELLVVVLIIGILAAVAVPQYQKAVLKSRYGSVMLTAKAIADGNEVYYLTQGRYADSVDDLDAQVTNAEGDMHVSIVGDSEDDYAYTMATRPDIKNNYIIYQRHSKNYPGEIHCEAENENAQAQWVCETAYHGTKIEDNTLNSGYTLYVLEGNGIKGSTSSEPETDVPGVEDPSPDVPEGPKWNGTDMLQSTYDLIEFAYLSVHGDNFEDDNLSLENGGLECISANELRVGSQIFTWDPISKMLTAPHTDVSWYRRWYDDDNHEIGSSHSEDGGKTWGPCNGTCR